MGTIDDTGIIFRTEVLPLIEERNYEKLKSLFNNYHLFYPISASKQTFLHCSVKSGNNEATQYLLDQGFHVNVQDSIGTTPLMIAVREKHIEIIQTLLAAGADIAMVNYKNKSVLHMIFQLYTKRSIVKLILHEVPKKYSTSQEMLQVLIDAGCSLHYATYLGNAEVLEYMLQQGFPVNLQNLDNKQTALHIAMLLEDVDSVKLLLKYGADADAMDSFNATPINYLYQFDEQHTCKKMELLQILLSLQVSLTSCNTRGVFQVSPILIDGTDLAIGMLLQANIDFKAKDDKNACNILHYLAINKNPGVVELLKIHANKYDVNVQNRMGLNPLYIAAGQANVDMVEFLLNQGATPNCAHILGNTPLYFAYSRFKPDLKEQLEQCVELLLQHNADPQFICTKDNKQLTIFDVATESNCLDSLKSVVAHLGLIEGSGGTITEITYAKIESCQPLKEYFNACQQLLRKRIHGSITLFQLLTADERKMARYFNNGELVPALTNSRYMKHLKSLHSYYYNTLVKRLLKGSRYSILLRKTTRVICKFFENRFDGRHLMIDKVIDCLDNESLHKLCQLQCC